MSGVGTHREMLVKGCRAALGKWLSSGTARSLEQHTWHAERTGSYSYCVPGPCLVASLLPAMGSPISCLLVIPQHPGESPRQTDVPTDRLNLHILLASACTPPRAVPSEPIATQQKNQHQPPLLTPIISHPLEREEGASFCHTPPDKRHGLVTYSRAEGPSHQGQKPPKPRVKINCVSPDWLPKVLLQ